MIGKGDPKLGGRAVTWQPGAFFLKQLSTQKEHHGLTAGTDRTVLGLGVSDEYPFSGNICVNVE